MIRTRSIIKNLSYDTLVKQGIIPDLTPLIQQVPTTIAVKRYPPFIYANKDEERFTFFGMLFEYIIRAGLRINLQQTFDLGIDPNINNTSDIVEYLKIYETEHNMYDVSQAALVLTSALFEKNVYTQHDIKNYIPTIINIIKEIITKWHLCDDYLTKNFLINHSLVILISPLINVS